MGSFRLQVLALTYCLVIGVTGTCLPFPSSVSACNDYVKSTIGGEFLLYSQPADASASLLTTDLARAGALACKTAFQRALCALAYRPCDNCETFGLPPCKSLCDSVNTCTVADKNALGITGANQVNNAAFNALRACDATPWATTNCYNGVPTSLKDCPSPSATSTPTPSTTPPSTPTAPPTNIPPTNTPTISVTASVSFLTSPTPTSSATPSVTPSGSVPPLPAAAPPNCRPIDAPINGNTQIVLSNANEGGCISINNPNQRKRQVGGVGYDFTFTVISGSIIRIDCSSGTTTIISDVVPSQTVSIFCPNGPSNLRISLVSGRNGVNAQLTTAQRFNLPSPSPLLPAPSASNNGNPIPAPPAPPAPARSPQPGSSPSAAVPPRQSPPPTPTIKDEKSSSSSIAPSFALLVSILLYAVC